MELETDKTTRQINVITPTKTSICHFNILSEGKECPPSISPWALYEDVPPPPIHTGQPHCVPPTASSNLKGELEKGQTNLPRAQVWPLVIGYLALTIWDFLLGIGWSVARGLWKSDL